MPHLRKPASALLILLWLIACGGGDGDPRSKGPNLYGNPGGGSGGMLEVEGLWTGQSNDGVQTALVVLEDGSAWGLQRRGGRWHRPSWARPSATSTGTVSPRSSGRNVFNLSISFKDACPLAEGALVNGVFFVDKSASPEQAYVLAQTADKDDRFFTGSAN